VGGRDRFVSPIAAGMIMIKVKVRVSQEAPRELELPLDSSLRASLAEALGEEDAEALDVRVGFPPRSVPPGNSASPQDLGLRDAAALIVRRPEDESGAKQGTKRARRPRKRMQIDRHEQSLREVDALARAHDALAERIAGAFKAGAKDDVAVFIRSDAKAMLDQAYKVRAGTDRYAAAHSGKFEIADGPPAKPVAIRFAPEQGGRKWTEEMVPLLDKSTLTATLQFLLAVQNPACKELAEENMRPMRMAVISPKTFWSIVKVMQDDLAAKDASMEDLMTAHFPEIDFSFLRARRRKKSAKALQNQVMENMMEERRAQEASAAAAINAKLDVKDFADLLEIMDKDEQRLKNLRKNLEDILNVEDFSDATESHLRQGLGVSSDVAARWLHRARVKTDEKVMARIIPDASQRDRLRKRCGVATIRDLERLRIPGRKELVVEELGIGISVAENWQRNAAEALENGKEWMKSFKVQGSVG